MSQKGNSIFAGSLALLIVGAFRKVLPLHNIPFFILCCAVFFAVALGMFYAQEKNLIKGIGAGDEKGQKTGLILSVAAVVILAVWIVLFGINEVSAPHPVEAKDLIRRTFPVVVWIPLMAVGTAICLFVLGKDLKKEYGSIRKKIRAVVTVCFAIGTSVQFYAPNILEDVQGNIYHSHAYTCSILNVAWLIPYSHRVTNNYGHYGLLFFPFLRGFHKVFGLDYLTTIALVCAVLQGISILVFAYVLNYFIKRDLIYYLALVGIGEYYFMLMQGGVFLQVHPHRMISPILLVLLVLQEQRKKKKYSILAILLLGLSIVWATDVGIIISLACSAYRWYDKIADGEGLNVRKCVNLIPQLLMFTAIPFAFAYLFVNAYNVAVGGPFLDYAEFMFPLVSEKGYIAHIELELPGIWNAWSANTILFMGAIVATIIPAFFPGKKRHEMYPVIFLMGTMGLGIMVYYMNRPVEGCLFVNIYIILILLALVLQKGQEVYLQYKEEGKAFLQKENAVSFLALRVIVMFLLFVMAFDSLYSLPKAWATSKNTIWKRGDLVELAEYIGMQVPPQAVCFGMAVPEILSMIDRDSNLHCTDWGVNDLAVDVLEDIRYELEDAQWIFCNMQSLYEMEQKFPGLSEQYNLLEIMEYGPYQFGLWARK